MSGSNMFWFLKSINDKICDLYEQIFSHLSYCYTTLRRLTMSSSQVPSSDTQYGLAYSESGPAYRSSEVQEATICTKETVRITPPLHNGVIQKPIMKDNVNQNGSYTQMNDVKYKKRTRKVSGYYDIADKSCQTEDIEYERHETPGDQCCTLRFGEQESTNSHTNTNTDFISTERHQESGRRSVNHIDVFVSEYQISLASNNVNSNTEQRPAQNSISCSSLDKNPEEPEKEEDEDEEESCGVKCCLFTWLLCDLMNT